MKRPIILSLAVDGRECYSEKVKALEKSIIDANWEGDVRIYKEWPDWITPHNSIPYAFKYDLITQARIDGYDKIYWMDSSIRLIPGKNIQDLLNKSEGIVAFDNLGHPLKHYINDAAIKNLEIDSLEGVKQTWGGCIFYNFDTLQANLIFDLIELEIMKGSFNEDNTSREDFKDHRHDQAVLSWLFHKNNIPLLPYGIIASKKDKTEETYLQYAD